MGSDGVCGGKKAIKHQNITNKPLEHRKHAT